MTVPGSTGGRDRRRADQPWYVDYRHPQPVSPPPDDRATRMLAVARLASSPTPAPTPPAPAPVRRPRPPARRPGGAKPAAKAKRGSTLPLLVGTPALLLVGVAVVSMTVLNRFGGGVDSAELDLDAAQTGVEKVLRDPVDGYGRNDVSDVRCNDGRNPTVTKGGGFTCSVNVGGAPRHVAVQFTDGAGSYRVDPPQ